MTVAETGPADPEAVARLVAQHRTFLGFLERRLPNREAAEEVLQSAFLRTMERGGQVEDSERVIAWFYRLLRNAIVDYYRRHARAQRSQDERSPDALPAHADPELHDTVCACVHGLLGNLRPEYADLLRRIDLEDGTIQDAAEALTITANNVRVRLHRARRALKRELERSCGTCATHGCLDCSCQKIP